MQKISHESHFVNRVENHVNSERIRKEKWLFSPQSDSILTERTGTFRGSCNYRIWSGRSSRKISKSWRLWTENTKRPSTKESKSRLGGTVQKNCIWDSRSEARTTVRFLQLNNTRFRRFRRSFWSWSATFARRSQQCCFGPQRQTRILWAQSLLKTPVSNMKTLQIADTIPKALTFEINARRTDIPKAIAVYVSRPAQKLAVSTVWQNMYWMKSTCQRTWEQNSGDEHTRLGNEKHYFDEQRKTLADQLFGKLFKLEILESHFVCKFEYLQARVNDAEQHQHVRQKEHQRASLVNSPDSSNMEGKESKCRWKTERCFPSW